VNGKLYDIAFDPVGTAKEQLDFIPSYNDGFSHHEPAISSARTSRTQSKIAAHTDQPIFFIFFCGGGGNLGEHFFRSIFSPNQAILSTFCLFHFFLKINKNCGHYVCLASLKIVVTIFGCHLH
jgi:hypothetical protein